MTHPRTTPQAAKPGLPRLRPVVSCGARAAAFLLCFALSALMVFAPFDVKLDRLSGFHIESSKAHAVAPYVAGASEFLSAAAAGAGLTESQFVATVVGMSSTAIGVNLGVNAGVNYGESLGQNLGSLMDAADYPDWDYLDNSDKEAWGTREYYETAKFNSLCDAFGLGDARQRFHSSGGGGSDFTPSEVTLLSNIGQIGSTWLNRGNVLFEDIKGMLTPEYNQVFEGYLGKRLMSFDGSTVNGWPLPFNEVQIGYGNLLTYRDGNTSNNENLATSNNVYWICTTSSTNRGFGSYMFSLSGFNYGSNGGSNPPTTLNNTSFRVTLNSDSNFVYECTYVGRGGTWNNLANYINMPLTVYSNSNWTNDNMYQACGLILKNLSNIESNYDPIEDYPGEEQIPDEQPIYYPEQGITNNTVWNNYITQPSNPDPDPENPPVVERPDNPFNPDDQSGTEKWKQDTSANIQGLGRVHFEKLFPFSLYYDLQMFWNKVQVIAGIGQGEGGLNTQASSQYETIDVRFYIPDVMDDTWTFDLEPVHDLLLITKPFVLVFLIFLEIISMIFFWKGILTGS